VGDVPEDKLRMLDGQAWLSQRSGDLGPLIVLLRELKFVGLADLMQRVRVIRPKGNRRGGDLWVAHAAELARHHKRKLREFGWKRKRGQKIEETAIKLAVADMRKDGLPVRPNENKFTTKVRNKLGHRQKASPEIAELRAELAELRKLIRAFASR
jgi:hypothetical protein